MIFGFLFFCFFLSAVPIGNPSSPALLQRGFFISDTSFSNLQVGCIEDFLFQKKFQARHTSRVFGLHKAQIEGVSQIGNITWNILERINFQIELGSGQFIWQWKQQNNQFVLGKISDGLIWSGSAKVVFFEIQQTSIAATAQAGGWNWMEGHGTVGGVPIRGTNRSKMHYWQLGGGITQKIGLFSPYVGIVANQTDLKISRLSTGTGSLRSWHKMGMFGGCTLSTASLFLFNLEWRAGLEQAFALSGQFRF